MTPVRLMGAARREVTDASDYYEVAAAGLGRRFEVEVQLALDQIAATPTRFPRTGRFGCRRHELASFPFGVVYRIEPTFVRVIAVAHHKRKPGYYNPRVRP